MTGRTAFADPAVVVDTETSKGFPILALPFLHKHWQTHPRLTSRVQLNSGWWGSTLRLAVTLGLDRNYLEWGFHIRRCRFPHAPSDRYSELDECSSRRFLFRRHLLGG